jgi:CRISP-associated protein Cas1
MVYASQSGRLPFVYIEMGRLKVQEGSVVFSGVDAPSYSIPCGLVSAIFIGMGVTVTDRAIRQVSLCDCSIIWVGEDITKCYAVIPSVSRTSKNFLQQIDASTRHRASVLKRFTAMRFGRKLRRWESLTDQKIRGIEGAMMRRAYIEGAKKYGIPYSGRMKGDEWNKNTAYNKAISLCNSYLYGMATAVIHGLGFSPALGILHQGDSRSLSYDVADIYKIGFSIPIGFFVASQIKEPLDGQAERETRKVALSAMKESNLVQRMASDILGLYDDGIYREEHNGKDKGATFVIQLPSESGHLRNEHIRRDASKDSQVAEEEHLET